MEKVLTEPVVASYMVTGLWWACGLLGLGLLFFIVRLINAIDANTTSNAHLSGAVDSMRREIHSTRKDVEQLRKLEPRVQALELINRRHNRYADEFQTEDA